MQGINKKATQDHLNSLQWLRGAAAMMVVVFHITEYLALNRVAPESIIFHLGSKGVDIFFVISGFIIMYAHARDIDRPSVSGIYCLKRLGRILPLYWTILIPVILLKVMVPQERPIDALDGGEINFMRIMTSIFLIPQEHHPILGVAWTLSHELFFYLLVGLAVWNKKLGVSVGSLVTVGCLVLPFFFSYPTLPLAAQFVFSPFNLEFLFGLVTALLFLKYEKKFSGKVVAGLCLLAGGVYVLGVLVPIASKENMLMRTALYGGGGALLIYIACVFGKLVDSARNPWVPVAEVVGASTYSIYLVHYPLMAACMHLNMKFAPQHLYLGGVATFVICICAGVTTYYLIEAPQQKAVGKLVKRFQQSREIKGFSLGQPRPMHKGLS